MTTGRPHKKDCRHFLLSIIFANSNLVTSSQLDARVKSSFNSCMVVLKWVIIDCIVPHSKSESMARAELRREIYI